ncbi:alpha-tectorin-like [Heteronotia binoei]|uniref:alpha-tectorin-like n=1 Tax=Heteronotia binoei TaxID=13085 RepID=UPI00292DF948|nr:alpha-tectorin-like [Heteronotia binoei]
MKISIAFLLLLLGSALPSPVPEAKLANGHVLYPYGEAVGDMKNPKDDDGTSPEIDIEIPFTFYGKLYHTVFVNNNGVISFGTPVSAYTPDAIPLKNGEHFVAPYWGDVNNMLGGDVYYREVKDIGKDKDKEELGRITRDMNNYFPEVPFKAIWAFIATWDRVAYFGSVSKKTNTFQAILTTDGKRSYIILIYGDIQWTTGAASGGDRRTGLGGTQAQAGFNSGDDKNYFSIPGSRTAEIINIIKTSNVHVPGVWVFRVDHFEVSGIPEELLHPAKEEEKANSNEEQGQQSNEPNETGEPQIVQGNEVNSEVQGQEHQEEIEPVPSGDAHEEEPQVSQDNEVNPEAEGQEKEEEVEPVPSGDVHEEEETQVSQDNEANPEAEGQEKEEEPVPSGDVHVEEEPQVNQDEEVNPEAEGQEKEEGIKPVPLENQDEKEESQGNQDYENPEEEGQQEEEENGGVSAVDQPDFPVEEPQPDTQIIDDSEEEEEDC